MIKNVNFNNFPPELREEIDTLIASFANFYEARFNLEQAELYALIPSIVSSAEFKTCNPEDFVTEAAVRVEMDAPLSHVALKPKQKRILLGRAGFFQAAWMYSLKALVAPSEIVGWQMLNKAIKYASRYDGHVAGQFTITDQQVDAAKKASGARQKENKKMKAEAFAFLDLERKNYRTKIAAAEAIVKCVAVELPTAQQWVREWHKKQDV